MFEKTIGTWALVALLLIGSSALGGVGASTTEQETTSTDPTPCEQGSCIPAWANDEVQWRVENFVILHCEDREPWMAPACAVGHAGGVCTSDDGGCEDDDRPRENRSHDGGNESHADQENTAEPMSATAGDPPGQVGSARVTLTWNATLEYGGHTAAVQVEVTQSPKGGYISTESHAGPATGGPPPPGASCLSATTDLLGRVLAGGRAAPASLLAACGDPGPGASPDHGEGSFLTLEGEVSCRHEGTVHWASCDSENSITCYGGLTPHCVVLGDLFEVLMMGPMGHQSECGDYDSRSYLCVGPVVCFYEDPVGGLPDHSPPDDGGDGNESSEGTGGGGGDNQPPDPGCYVHILGRTIGGEVFSPGHFAAYRVDV